MWKGQSLNRLVITRTGFLILYATAVQTELTSRIEMPVAFGLPPKFYQSKK
jgi:hypothetical protein